MLAVCTRENRVIIVDIDPPAMPSAHLERTKCPLWSPASYKAHSHPVTRDNQCRVSRHHQTIISHCSFNNNEKFPDHYECIL